MNEDFGRREFLFEIVDDRTAASDLVVEVLLDGSARNLVHEPEIRRSGSGWTLSLQSIKNAFGEGGLEISAIDTAGLSGRLLVPLVVASVNDVPSVRILTPRSGETFPVGTTTRVEVDVIDPDSDIEKAEFYVDSVLFATVRNAPYSVVLENDSPGERFVEVIVQDLAGDRSEVRSLNYDVVPPPLRETVSLNAPLVGADYCVGTPIQFLAAVSFSDAEINRVEFFADETLLGFDEEFPYELTWRQPMSGTLSLKAVAVKQDGETIVSESRRIFVQAACDGTVVITAGESGEIETVLDYLFEMGIGAVAIDQTEVSEAILRRFDLMIVHVGHAGALADATISLLSRLRRTGETIEDQRSMYFIGSHLSSEGQRWDLGVATIWSSLVGLTSSEKSLVPGTVEAVGEEGLEDLLAGPFGEMGSFDYSLDVEDARAADGADVLLRSGLTDLAVVQPSLDLVDLNVPRILSQNFHLRVADDVAGNLERKRFFQNSVCWLLHCNACGSADLRVELQEGDNRTNPGGIVRQLRVVNRGTCPALSARVVGRLPAGLELVAVTSIRHILWRQKLDSGEFSVLLGDLPPGFEGEVSLEFELNDAVQIRENVDWEICAEANNSETLCLTTMLANMGGRPPQLRLERVGNDFLLSVATEVGAAYRLETSVDLREWVPIDWQSGSLGAWTVPVANGTGSEARFYRLARQP